jgi:hypothetical protein
LLYKSNVMRDKTEYLVYRYIGNTIEDGDQEGLHYEPFYKNFGDDVLDGRVEYIKANDTNGWKGHTSAIDINYMEQTLKKLKDKGATHVEIMFHSDHDSYCISGVEIRKPTQDEIERHIEIANERRTVTIEDEIAKVKMLLLNLEGERDKLNTNG